MTDDEIRAWLRTRRADGWVEIEAWPGQPLTAAHVETVTRQAAAGLPIADAAARAVAADALLAEVLAGAPIPEWLRERVPLRVHAQRRRRHVSRTLR